MNTRRNAGTMVVMMLAGLAMVAAATANGCGGSTKVESRSTTVGQELQDLDDARNKGLLTEEEYNKKREDILKQR